DLVVVGGTGADVATGWREVPHGEEIARDLDDLLLGVGVGAHANARFRGHRPPRSTRPGRRAAGTPSTPTATPLTSTCSTPSAPCSNRRWRCGRSYTMVVGRVPMRRGSKHTRSAA